MVMQAEVKAEVKEILDEYVLLVFDIPANQAKLRKEVLKFLAAAGAVMHTASCYLMPYSELSFAIANEIALKGDVVVWVSKQKDQKKAKALTIQYDEHLKIRCTTIEQRLWAIKEHIESGQLGRANRMAEKTHALLDQLKKISQTYCPSWLLPRIGELETMMQQIYTGE
jgi:CRISPR/Cas system-associated protein endoribonuclease Cas2